MTAKYECPRSPNKRHDWYVENPVEDRSDKCRWCGKFKHLPEDQKRREAISDDRAWASGYAAGRAAATLAQPADACRHGEVQLIPGRGARCGACGATAWFAAHAQPAPDPLREAYLAGVRRGASDGMDGYPMVADDYLAAPARPVQEEEA